MPTGPTGQALARPRWRALLRLAAWSALEAGETFLLGYALARALDRGFLAGHTDVGLGWLGLAALGVLAGSFGTGRVHLAVAALVEPVRDDLVRKVVRRALRAPDGAAVSRLTHQVEIARDTLAGLVMVSRTFVVTAVGALIGLFSLAPVLLPVVALPLAAGLALFLATLRPLARRQEVFLAADEALAAELGLAVGGLRDITAAGAQDRVGRDVRERIDAEFHASRALARWGVLRTLAAGIGGRLTVVLLLAAAPWLLDHGVTPGAFVGALAYLTQSLIPALQSLMQGLGTSGARLFVVLRRLTADPGAGGEAQADPLGAPGPGEAVRLRGVTFAYGPGAAPVVDHLDLTVPHGGHLAVVGPSGIGKSTLAELMAGVRAPDSGEVLRGCARVLVPQQAYVFTDTVRANLTYLCPDDPPGDEDLLDSCTAVGARELVDRLGGLDATLAPSELSAGERQLIALARAYAAPAPLVLLDEATCHLDPAAEARAERAFARRPGTALVVVAHRTGSAGRARQVLVLGGDGVERGTHDELLQQSAFYRELTGLHPSLALGDADGVHAVAGAGLAGDRRHVVPHGPVGQMEAVRDVRDRGALGGE
ncbi:ABC transporter ATP-binding protein [Streptomyces sp. BPTC-684]|uniref:ATP-binding cassette domain-containing protein n=1 Tax=Streptomyces sp. BPTC-684 TaxID=3043734 RepID=UPI0024B09984|nr:ABC transporter ATP-binding protein [Streptomyces sp. BPTC-684]WHM38916.1 ABC transporter ATP-binding protein [Streptomyces sp. BPTC-684]